MQLSPGQDKALKAMSEWYENWSPDRPFFYLAGYAGCGKTTLESIFTENISGRVIRAADTGKAALRMQEISGRAASTIHSVIYTLVEQESGHLGPPEFILDDKSSLNGAQLLVLDECSMINQELGEDILAFNRPVLVLGDPGQLPPIKGAGYFTKRKPDAMLTEVHRQALDSTIIRVATDIRSGKDLARTNEPDCIIYPYVKDFDGEAEMLMADQVLCGTNKSRVRFNNWIRELKGFTTTRPVVGDKLVCLKNQRKMKLFNGLLTEVSHIRTNTDKALTIDLESDIGSYKDVPVFPMCFDNPEELADIPYSERKQYSEFDYGYCLTVHKAQGSQWDNLLLIDDGFMRWKKEVRAQWLYTAITRAAKKLTILNYKGK